MLVRVEIVIIFSKEKKLEWKFSVTTYDRTKRDVATENEERGS